MGTNFEWRERAPLRELLCGSHGRYRTVHVGKQSGGWSFSFRAWPEDVSPFGFPVLSRADWRRVFTERRGSLWDEYGRRRDDPVAWLDDLEPPDATQQDWEEFHMGPYWRPDPAREWRDAEGFRFTAAKFS